MNLVKRNGNQLNYLEYIPIISPAEIYLRKLNSFRLENKIIEEIENYQINNKLRIGSQIKFDLIKTSYDILNNNFNLNLSMTPKDILDIFSLRYRAFKNRNYNDLIGNELQQIGLNFDQYDKSSILLKYNRKENITASSRLILDTYEQLPSEKLFDSEKGFNQLREYEYNRNKNIAEISRSVIEPKYQGKGNEFKKIFTQIYQLKNELNIGTYITTISKEDYKLYQKVGFEIIKEDFGYNQINRDILYLSWDVENVNSFFKKVFLK